MGGGGGGGRGTASSSSSSSSSSSRDVAALFDNEDAQKRASREILERHAPSQRCGGAALRVWFRLSGGAFIIRVFILITHLFIHRDHLF